MNIVLRENQTARIFVTIPLEMFEVYGGTQNGNFIVENTDVSDQVVVEIPAQGSHNCSMVRYELFARNKSTGHEWLVLNGIIKMVNRESSVDGSTVTTPDYYMTIPISENGTVIQGTQIITGIKGERGYSAYEVACQQGFEGSEEEWFESIRQQTATLSVERVTPLMNRAEEAALNAANSETQAGKYAANAQSAEEQSEINATDAAQSAKNAAAEHERAVQMAQSAASSAAEAQEAAQAASNDMGATNSFMHQTEVYAEAAEASAEVADQKAKAAESSASEAFGSASQAKASETAAAKSATQAAMSATEAAENAELLGDAALQNGDNTFTGKNVFNGAVSGSGTLFGVPMGRWMGLSSIFSKVALTADEFKLMFPEWETAAVWPYVDTSKWGDKVNMGYSTKSGARYVFFTGGDWYYPEGRGYCEEMWFYIAGDPWMVTIHSRGLKNYIFAPALTNGGDHGFESWADYGSTPDKTIRTVFYAPKLILFRISGRWDARREQTHEVTLACNPAPNKKLHFTGGNTIRLVNANFCNCTLVNVESPVHVEKETILTILNTLPAYDAETMTTVPTCTFYVDPEYEGDEELINAFLNLQTAVEEGGKGWTVAVSGISLTGAATLDLEPTVYCKKLADSAGQYIDADGERWDVSSGTVVLRHGAANEQLGYEPFASVEDALAEWGLTPYIDPKLEQHQQDEQQ